MTSSPEPDLPLDVIRHDSDSQPVVRRRWRFRKRYLLVLLIPVLMFSGGVIGMYYQPIALQKFYALTGLQPGAGSATPIALPPDMKCPRRWWRPCRPAMWSGWPG
ncbi:hypothetical protein ACK6D9_17170 [Hoeflea sp. Naph1]|uniref:hypothetical protein n=1 Tax=Hoeflea sp. Naph1 TaxID=3388653 RepID=UPI00398FBCC2